MAVQTPNVSKDTCDCLHKLTSDFLIQPLLAAVHPFLYVHIGY